MRRSFHLIHAGLGTTTLGWSDLLISAKEVLWGLRDTIAASEATSTIHAVRGPRVNCLETGVYVRENSPKEDGSIVSLERDQAESTQ